MISGACDNDAVGFANCIKEHLREFTSARLFRTVVRKMGQKLAIEHLDFCTEILRRVESHAKREFS